MNNKDFKYGLILLPAFLSAFSGQGNPEEEAKPNFIIIYTDD